MKRPVLSRCLLLISAFVGFVGFGGKEDSSRDDLLVGGEFAYTVKKGDSLASVGARFGVEPRWLALRNQLSPVAGLRVGQVLRVDNRHVIPFLLEAGILINIPQRLLFLFREGRLVSWYPVAVGRRDWPTAAGLFEIQTLERHPTWDVPVSIQREMRRLGRSALTRVPPGPENPLGDYWIGLEGSGCGIHGTNAPTSIYGFRTHGCIRLHPEDIADLFPRVSRGMPVRIIYEPVLLARGADGWIFLEVNPDVYGRQKDRAGTVAALAESANLQTVIDPAAVQRAVTSQEGLATRVDLPISP